MPRNTCNLQMWKIQFSTIGFGPLYARFISMEGKTKERWLELCEQATVEQDAEKLLELTEEINRLLKEKETRQLKMRMTGNISRPKQA
jgi:hypothetical protein